MTTNKYSEGHDEAKIPNLSWVDADWGKGDNCINKLRMLNGAFETYFVLLQSIGQCEDAGQKSAMTSELQDAAENGWGFGVQDLDDAFTHWLAPGHWTDGNTASYMRVNGTFGTQNPAIAGVSTDCCWGLQTNIMPGPAAAVNFFNALDDKMDTLNTAIQAHNDQVKKLADGVTNKDSSAVDKAFRVIADKAKIAKKFLWLAPKLDDGPAATAIQGGKTFIKSITDIDTFLTVHKQALATGIFNNASATALAAFTVALGKVPVLGSFYKQMGKGIPGLISGVKDEMDEYYKKIDQAYQAR